MNEGGTTKANCIALRPLKKEDEGHFYLSLSISTANEQSNSVKAVKGRVVVSGCMQRAGNWWKARMSADREKNP